jgi:hypothetical protein
MNQVSYWQLTVGLKTSNLSSTESRPYQSKLPSTESIPFQMKYVSYHQLTPIITRRNKYVIINWQSSLPRQKVCYSQLTAALTRVNKDVITIWQPFLQEGQVRDHQLKAYHIYNQVKTGKNQQTDSLAEPGSKLSWANSLMELTSYRQLTPVFVTEKIDMLLFLWLTERARVTFCPSTVPEDLKWISLPEYYRNEGYILCQNYSIFRALPVNNLAELTGDPNALWVTEGGVSFQTMIGRCFIPDSLSHWILLK